LRNAKTVGLATPGAQEAAAARVGCRQSFSGHARPPRETFPLPPRDTGRAMSQRAPPLTQGGPPLSRFCGHTSGTRFHPTNRRACLPSLWHADASTASSRTGDDAVLRLWRTPPDRSSHARGFAAQRPTRRPFATAARAAALRSSRSQRSQDRRVGHGSSRGCVPRPRASAGRRRGWCRQARVVRS
jgi:hypothetical protein